VDPVIRDYVPNQTVINPDALTTDDQELKIDQSKYYAIEIDDVDKRQVKGELLSKGATRAGYRLKLLADTYIGSRMVQGAGTVLSARTIAPADPDDLYQIFVDLKTAMDNLELPQDSRWIAGTPDQLNQLAWDPRFTSAQNYGSNSLITNGEMGSILGFRIKVNTNAPIASNPNQRWMIAGQGNQGMTFAQQISKTVAYRPESSFSDAIKGLHVYGGKVIQPEYLAAVPVTVSATAP
ncbi:hypothetical protein, partial [Pseudomonas sp. AMR01]|uniref:phage major capsid protein n=1 Tax=Pseudomonas sp. AMR01 TaxID=3064904 RepID=UPI0035BF6E12